MLTASKCQKAASSNYILLVDEPVQVCFTKFLFLSV
jgi:hypothetical protein